MAIGPRWRGLTYPVLVLGGLYLALGVALVIPRITADGVAYYAETRSLLLDGDLDLADEYAVPIDRYSPLGDPGPRAVVPRDPDGSFDHSVNLGMVVLLGPFLAFGHVGAAVLDAFAALLGRAPPVSMDGFGVPSVLAVAFGTNALVAAGLALLALAIAPAVGRRTATAAAAATWLGSALFFWSTQRPAHAHAPLVFVECVFVAIFLLRARDARARLAWLALGACWGLLLSVRPITAIYGIVPAGYLLLTVGAPAFRAWSADRVAWQDRLGAAAGALAPGIVAGLLFVAGSVVGRLASILFARDLNLFGSGYYTDTAYLRAGLVGDPLAGLRSLLFDPLQGAVWWVPLVPLSILGLVVVWRRDRWTALTGVAIAAGVWGFASILGAPERFGGVGLPSRHLVEATPAVVIGVAGLLAGGRLLAARFHDRPTLANIARWTVPVAIGVMVGWAMLAQLAGAVIDATGDSPFARVAAVLSRPTVLGRLWYTPATETAAEGKVAIGGQLAQALVDGDPAAFGAFLLGTAWLVVLGLVVGGFAALAWSALGPSAPEPAGHPAPDPDARPASPAGQRSRSALRWLPWLGVAAILAAATAPAFAEPGDVRDGVPVTIRTWDGRSDRRPAGVVTSITYGSSPSGNRVVLPPTPASPDAVSPPETITRGTFGPVGDGREVVATAPAWDVLTEVILWFGPTFEPDAAAAVTVGFDGAAGPTMRRELTAEDLALGTVAVQLPMRLREFAGDPLRIRVEAVSGAPIPEVSIRADGSLAYRLRGIAPRPMPEITADDEPIIPLGGPDLALPENGSLTVDEAGARMRIGPWGPTQLLRWSLHGPWRLPGPTTVPGSWGDSTARDPGTGPIDVVIEAPVPIASVTATMLVTAYDPEPGGVATIGASTDGTTFVPLAGVTPDIARRQVQLSGSIDVGGSPTTVVYIRLDADPTTGTIGINGVWFDVDLVPFESAVGTASTSDLDIDRSAPRSATVPLAIEAAGGAGRANLLLRAAGDLAVALFQVPGALGGVTIAAALLVAALAARRVASSAVGAAGLAALAGLWLVASVALAGRTVLLPGALPFDLGTGTAMTVGSDSMTADAPGATYRGPLIPFPEGSDIRIVGAVGGAPVAGGLAVAGQDGSLGPTTTEPATVDRTGGVVVDLVAEGPGPIDLVVLRADPWARAR